MKTQSFHIGGMSCSACSAWVEKSLRKQSGITKAVVNLALEKATVEFDELSLTPNDIQHIVEEAGYTALPIERTNTATAQKEIEHRQEQALRDLNRRFIISIIGASAVMVLSMITMLPSFSEYELVSNVLQLILSIPVLWFGGSIFYRRALTSARHGASSMDTLITISSLSAFAYSSFITIIMLLPHDEPTGLVHSMMSSLGHPHTYFDSATTIIAMLLLGKVLESRAKKRALSALNSLQSLRNEKATVLREGVEFVISTDDVETNDTVIIKPGERLPVDGVISKGESTFDESIITGESMPVVKSVGAEVYAGTINLFGSVNIMASGNGEESTVATITRITESAQLAKSPVQLLADRISAWFVPAVLILSVLTFAVWYWVIPNIGINYLVTDSPFVYAFLRAITVLVIACPCALGLAVPVAISVAFGSAWKSGVVIHSASEFEDTGRIGLIVFDKTGTLTEGKPKVATAKYSSHYSNQSLNKEDELLSLIGIVEARSEHPIAKALYEFAQTRLSNQEDNFKSNTDSLSVLSFTATAGGGVEATVNVEGTDTDSQANLVRAVVIGSARFLTDNGVQLSEEFWSIIQQCNNEGLTPIHVSIDGLHSAVFGVSDQLRVQSKQAVQELTSLGIETVLCSGDTNEVAHRIAENVGIHRVYAGVLPQGKQTLIENLRSEMKTNLTTQKRSYKRNKLAMVGDGVNDAPALSSADVGIAMGSGSGLAQTTAGITLLNNNLHSIIRVIELSRLTGGVIRQNLFFAFIYNVIGIVLATGLIQPFGYTLTPMFSAFAMAMSSVSVVLNALRIRKH
jgi:P-type Cu+ transporter